MKKKWQFYVPSVLLLGALVLAAWQVAAARPPRGLLATTPFKRVIVDRAGPEDPHTKDVGDLNGDHYPDILAASSAGGPLVWYEYPCWTKHEIAPQGSWSADAEVVDLDRDGDQDIVISEWYQLNRIEWYENPGPAGNPAADPWKLHVVGSPRAHDIEVGDLDKDGDVDLVTRQQKGSGDRIEIWVQNTPLSWTHRGFDSPSGEGLHLEDLDMDGFPDVVLSERWYQNPRGVVSSPWNEFVYTTAYRYQDAFPWTADLNKDGRLDIVLTPHGTAGETYRTSWFEAPSDPKTAGWAEHIIDPEVETVTHSLGVADLDRDGDQDVMTAEMHQSEDPDEWRIYWNGGNGASWTKQVLSQTGSHNAVIADIGADSDFDILGANWSGGYQPIELWENAALKPAKTCGQRYHFLPFVHGR